MCLGNPIFGRAIPNASGDHNTSTLLDGGYDVFGHWGAQIGWFGAGTGLGQG